MRPNLAARTMTVQRAMLLAVAISPLMLSHAADFDVRSYGAKGDGVTFDTEAVQKAIDARAADGGGRVVLENGVFLVKPIMLKSGIDLHIARNARLLGSGDWRDYPNRGNLKHVISENMPRARDAAHYSGLARRRGDRRRGAETLAKWAFCGVLSK